MKLSEARGRTPKVGDKIVFKGKAGGRDPGNSFFYLISSVKKERLTLSKNGIEFPCSCLIPEFLDDWDETSYDIEYVQNKWDTLVKRMKNG